MEVRGKPYLSIAMGVAQSYQPRLFIQPQKELRILSLHVGENHAR